MSKSNNLTDFLLDIADGIREKKGTLDKINPQDFKSEIDSLYSNLEAEQFGQCFTPVPYIVKKSDGTTSYVSSNPNLGFVTEETEESVNQFPDMGVVTRKVDLNGNTRIFKRWSLVELNHRWELNNFRRTIADGGTYNLTEPIGLAVRCNRLGWQLLGWPYFKDDSVVAPSPYYDITGTTAVDHVNNLRHSHRFYGGSPFYNSIASGSDTETDIVNNKDSTGIAGKILSNAWSVIAGDDSSHLKFRTENTKKEFTFPKLVKAGAVYGGTEDNNERTEYLWQFTEWYRHSFAIYSGKTTTDLSDNGSVEVLILNASGEQAAVGEDMYFWLSDGTNKVNTNLLAKYNINAQHGISGGSSYKPLRSTVRDFIYNKQVANGVNMNDTGVNSSTKPILTPGSKGAEAVLVDDKWMIITPIITWTESQTSLDYNIPDAPAVAWAKNIVGLGICSDILASCYYYNKNTQSSSPKVTNLFYSLISYLASYEGWFSTTYGVRHRMVYYINGYGSNALWCCSRFYANSSWCANAVTGNISNSYSSVRCRVLCSAAL